MSAKPDLWMPLYLGAYIADTLRFTTEQHGAYLLLIMDYWRNGPPPDDDKVLAQISKLSVPRWKAHRVVIAPKFQISNGVWRHKRIEHELGRARDLQEVLSERGKAGAAARWGKDSPSNATGNATGNAKADAQAMPADAPLPLPRPLQTQGPRPSPSPTSTPLSGSLPDAAVPRAKNGNAAFHPDAEDVLGYLNKSAGKGYEFRNRRGELTASAERIIQRLKQGYTREELREVVHAKCGQWLTDDRMVEYLRPATLFAKENFEQYLGELKGAGNG